ncbi:hypothetical protein SDC9_193492 [bioreactor metagenome]|uniref:Uncharacterized protein n=1 Tax=bioreactor metagenome TaxID=1076179 RepID=A0A645IEW3_9ZZZZ
MERLGTVFAVLGAGAAFRIEDGADMECLAAEVFPQLFGCTAKFLQIGRKQFQKLLPQS